MIITARVARNIADPTLNKKSDFPKNQVRQLRKIESAIIRASKKGLMFVEYYDDMYHCVLDVLEKNGYKVMDYSKYECHRYVISWEKQK